MPQFVLDEAELTAVYSCISGEGSVVSSMMLLSKPEINQWSPSDVYEDCYLLTLSKEGLLELIGHVSEESGEAGAFALIAGNLERGLLSREDEEDEEDERGPGGRLSAFNEDNSPRESYQGDGYCVACRETRDFEGYVKIADSGRRMAMGMCHVCGTYINRILGESENG